MVLRNWSKSLRCPCGMLQVVLPEGAHDISVEVPFEVELTYEPK